MPAPPTLGPILLSPTFFASALFGPTAAQRSVPQPKTNNLDMHTSNNLALFLHEPPLRSISHPTPAQPDIFFQRLSCDLPAPFHPSRALLPKLPFAPPQVLTDEIPQIPLGHLLIFHNHPRGIWRSTWAIDTCNRRRTDTSVQASTKTPQFSGQSPPPITTQDTR